MNVGFTDSQLELRSSVREVLARECSPAVVRAALDDPERWRPLWKTATDLGWPALAMLDDEAGMGVVELVAVLEECGEAAAPLPLLSSAGLVGGVLRAAGASAGDLVGELAEGAIGALGATAVGSRQVGAALTYDGTRLRGTTGPVADVAIADVLVLLATDSGGGTVAAVVRPGEGVHLHPHVPLDPTRSLAGVEVDVVPERVLPIELAEAMAVPLTAAAAELAGVTTRLLDLAVTHAIGREQFGRPIGSFQGIKHRLADSYVLLERARSLTYAAAMLVSDPDAPAVDRWRAALLAKAAAGEAATETARAAVQVHGAMAMTWEHDVHLYLRRAWQSAALLGESNALYAAAARLLVEAV
jgi:alkylation response protein AidB-like acyl-CoA dehydrogenase